MRSGFQQLFHTSSDGKLGGGAWEGGQGSLFFPPFHPQACPFELEVFTEDCEGEIEIVDLLPFSPIVDPALCQLVMERGVCEESRDSREELYTHTLSTPHMTTIAVENKVRFVALSTLTSFP